MEMGKEAGRVAQGLRSFGQKETEALACGALGSLILVKGKSGPVGGLLGQSQAKDKKWGTQRCWDSRLGFLRPWLGAPL